MEIADILYTEVHHMATSRYEYDLRPYNTASFDTSIVTQEKAVMAAAGWVQLTTDNSPDSPASVTTILYRRTLINP